MVTKTTKPITSEEMEDLLFTCLIERAPCALGNLNEIRDYNGRTLLHWTVNLNLKEETLILLQDGADPNVKDDDGQTPLHISGPEIAQLLIKYGADVNARDRLGRTPLHYAKNPDLARLLLEAGANPDTCDVDGNTPLHTAPEAAEILLQYGANPNAKNKKGLPPIYYALLKGACEAASLLLQVTDKNLLSNLKDESGNTLLHLASNNCRELVQPLLNFIDVNVTDNDGNTPLHIAVFNRDVELIKLLISSADIRAKNKYGVAPLTSIALMCRNGGPCITEIIDHLHHPAEVSEFVKDAFHYGQLQLLRALLQRGLSQII
jgi:ankyrin repeat protein